MSDSEPIEHFWQTLFETSENADILVCVKGETGDVFLKVKVQNFPVKTNCMQKAYDIYFEFSGLIKKDSHQILCENTQKLTNILVKFCGKIQTEID